MVALNDGNAKVSGKVEDAIIVPETLILGGMLGMKPLAETGLDGLRPHDTPELVRRMLEDMNRYMVGCGDVLPGLLFINEKSMVYLMGNNVRPPLLDTPIEALIGRVKPWAVTYLGDLQVFAPGPYSGSIVAADLLGLYVKDTDGREVNRVFLPVRGKDNLITELVDITSYRKEHSKDPRPFTAAIRQSA